jgi:hypothetical protein
MNIKNFNNLIINSPNKRDSIEVVNLLKENPNNVDFYNLCHKYLDIALNADKWYDEEKKALACCNRFVDIDNAVLDTKEFISKYTITDNCALLDMLKYRYRDCRESTDTRQIATMIKSDSNTGFFGTFYSLIDIPSWDDIKKDILSKL